MTDYSRRDVLRTGATLAAGAALAGTVSAASRGLTDYDTLDATAMAALVRKREVSATELLEEALARMAKWNPLLNAVVLHHEDLARQTAKNLVDGPLAGVPFLLKDLGTYLAGTVTTEGSRFFRDAVAERDSFLVERYKRAGLVIFGKTATPEFGKSAATESLLWGDTRNPWNLEHTPCGSSGGSAAAVAAGILPVAHGNDGGGSIRLPSSACGLFGLKPSRFRVPLGPDRGDGGGVSTQHVLSRSVRDSALLLDLTQGPEPGGYGGIPAPERPFIDELGRAPGKLRIALMKTPVLPMPVHPECVKAVENAARLCESLGHHVEEVTLPIDGMETLKSAGLILSLASNLSIRAREKVLGRAVTQEDIEPITWLRLQQYAKASAEELGMARNQQVKTHRQMTEFMKNYDVILSPTLPLVPGKIGDQGPRLPIEEFDRNATPYSMFTLLYNFTGQPAMSVPLHWTPEGLPVGVQFAGRYAEEGLLLRLASQLEQAAPWFNRRPAFPG